MKDLNWRAAMRRAAVFVGIWLVLIYVVGVAFPGSFGISRAEAPSLAINAILFFSIFTLVYALTDRRRARRMAETRNKGGTGKRAPETTGDGEEEPAGPLKGRYNPNTSRKKARRRR